LQLKELWRYAATTLRSGEIDSDFIGRPIASGIQQAECVNYPGQSELAFAARNGGQKQVSTRTEA
jgi:hypothetical protein